MKMYFLFTCFVLMSSIVSTGYAQGNRPNAEELERRAQLEQSFKDVYGEDWVFSWDNEFNTIYMMIGSYEPAFGITSEEEAHAFINTFLADVDSFIRVDPIQLVPKDSTYVNPETNSFGVTFRQNRNNIKVEYTRLTIAVLSNRQEIKVSNNLFPDDLDMGISFVPSLSVEEAIERVQNELHEGEAVPLEGEPILVIYPPDRYHSPYGDMEIDEFHLCYFIADLYLFSHVDAISGEIVTYRAR